MEHSTCVIGRRFPSGHPSGRASLPKWALPIPPKVRKSVADLEKAGFVWRGGRGSHRKFEHPALKNSVVLSGSLGDDAKPYQVRAVIRAIRESRS